MLVDQGHPEEYEIEKAKSGIQKCHKCKETIAKDELRLIARHEGHHHHMQMIYTHIKCIDPKTLHDIELKKESIEKVPGSQLLTSEELKLVQALR